MIIGIYGGSFDPIHTGHAMVANFIAQCNIVDEVWIMVSRQNPLKINSVYADDFHRLEMARIVAKNCKNVKVSDLEMSLPAPSYTYDTLLELKKKYPEHEFKIILGGDSLVNFHKWKNADKIQMEFGVIVYPRPGYPLDGPEPLNMKFLTGAPEFSMSSTLIREYISSGWNINYFTPIDVSKYINANHLYR